MSKNKELSPKEKNKVTEIEEMLESNYVGEMYQEYMDAYNDIKKSKEKIKRDLRTIRGIATDLSYFTVQKKRNLEKQKSEYVQKKDKKKSKQKE